MLITCSHKIVQVTSLFRTCLCDKVVIFTHRTHGSPTFLQEAATDPSESELMESGEALASKVQAKVAAKRAARRSSAPEKPKVSEGEGGRKWQNFWKSHILIYIYIHIF